MKTRFSCFRLPWNIIRCGVVLAGVAAAGKAPPAAGQEVIAVPAIDVGHHVLQPEMADQKIPILVSGGLEVEGVNFYIQVADGGPEAADFGFIDPPGISGPHITDVDLITGTIFAPNNAGHIPGGGSPEIPQFFDCSILTADGPVDTDGLLATVTIDTTGFSGGRWDLFVDDNTIETKPTHFIALEVGGEVVEVTPDSNIGSITVIPEPSTFGLLAAGLALPLVRRLRRKKG